MVDKYRRHAGLAWILGVLLLISGCAADRSTLPADRFYDGERITLVVTQPPGGGFDTYARLYARCMPDHIPGHPEMVVQNMPGAGNVVGMNYLFNVADRDGTVIGTGEGGVALQQLFGAEGVQFDMSALEFLGMPDAPVNMVLVARSDVGVASIDDVLSGPAELKVGIPAPGSLLADPALLLEDVLDARIRIVPGYEGTGPTALAVEQGEIHAFFASSATVAADYQDRLDSGEWRTLLQTAEPGAADHLDGVPTLLGLAGDPEQRAILQTGVVERSYIRPFFAPPGVPADRLTVLRDAWSACNEDPDFLATAKAAKRPIEPVPGAELTEIYSRFVQETPPARIEELRSALTLEF